jgi:hypothetical protein
VRNFRKIYSLLVVSHFTPVGLRDIPIKLFLEKDTFLFSQF